MCKSLFVNLGGSGGSIGNGFLQTALALSSTPQVVEDNLGNDSLLGLGTNKLLLGIDNTGGSNPHTINIKTNTNVGSSLYSDTWFNCDNDITFSANRDFVFGSGATRNGRATIQGSGGNIISLRDNSNVEVTTIDNSGNISLFQGNANFKGITQVGSKIQHNYQDGQGIFFSNSSSGYKTLILGGVSADICSFGGVTTSFPALKAANTPATISATDATGSGLIPFIAENFKGKDLTSGSLTTARAFRFGDKATITDALLTALGLTTQLAIEHNGQVYYIPVSTTQFS